MTQPLDKMRAEFEAWAEEESMILFLFPAKKDVTPRYQSPVTEAAWTGWQAACAQQSAQSTIEIDVLANEIRRVDGSHALGAGALAEALIPFLSAQSQQDALAPLTDEQIKSASLKAGMQEHYMGFHSGFIKFARAIEAGHGITAIATQGASNV